MAYQTFKLGDRVRVAAPEGFRGTRLSKEAYVIEKEHKGNGNLIVAGVQFAKRGGLSRGGSSWSYSRLVMAGSDEAARLDRDYDEAQRRATALTIIKTTHFKALGLSSLEEIVDLIVKLKEKK